MQGPSYTILFHRLFCDCFHAYVSGKSVNGLKCWRPNARSPTLQLKLEFKHYKVKENVFWAESFRKEVAML